MLPESGLPFSFLYWIRIWRTRRSAPLKPHLLKWKSFIGCANLLDIHVPDTYTEASGIGGILTSRDCLSNTIALVAAREHLFPGSGLKGIPVLPKKIRVLVPDVIEHYSIRSAMAWLSLGEQNVIHIPVDDESCMDHDVLKRIIEQERGDGNHILACVAYAGRHV